MAKSKVATIESELTKKYGDIIVSAANLHELEGKLIPTTLGLDIALNGGIIEGSLNIIAGNSGSGKSTLCLEILSNALAMDKELFYMDLELRLKTSLIDCIEGLTKEKLNIIRPKTKIMAAEEALNICEQTLKDSPGCVLVMDSIASLFPEAAYAGEIGDSKQMGGVSRLMYEFCRRIAQVCAITKSTFIGITHVQSNLSGYGGPKAYGGNAIQYFASNILVCLSSPEYPKESNPKKGRISEFKVIKATLGPPGSASVIIKYGSGCDKYRDLAENAELMGLIEKAGAWYKVNIGHKTFDEIKVQGMENLSEELRSNKELFNLMNKTVRELAFGKKK